MPRLQPVTPDSADRETRELLDGVRKKMGGVPNLIATMAQSPAVANAYLGFSQALSTGSLRPALREQLALAVGEANGCSYCVAAHTALGKRAGLSGEQAVAARRGEADNERDRAALELARKIVSQRAEVSDEDIQAVRDAGFDDGEIAEIVAHVALNIFTNYFNHVAETEIDFPAVPELSIA